ncbi:MAG: hypothetical protein KIT60_30040 [Burkholderiaceae bacterium]|nr:hypothetical protein [Burkholderiaceae bacterium]
MSVEPIQQADIESVSRFLHAHLNRRISPAAWAQAMQQRWCADPPNLGMQLRTPQGELAGVLLALYSEQVIDGRVERFCNPHSWCVLDSHRHASIGLVLAIQRQRGYHFTMFTPNPKVTQVFLGLRFELLDDRLLYFPNLARPWRLRGEFVEARPEAIAARLSGTARAEFEAHRHLPWLNFVAFGAGPEGVLAIYKTGRWKKMPCALLTHVSDPQLASRHGHMLRQHLLRRGLLVSRIEGRFLQQAPPLSHRAVRLQPKLALTRGLTHAQVRDVYSELMALDI